VKKAFTLLELLVVIAIIATLTGLSLAAYSKVKVASARAVSVHSLGQMIAGGQAYLTDNDNAFWPYEQVVTGGAMWWFGFETTASLRMAEGTRTVDYSKGPLGPYASASGGIKTDPAFLQYAPRLKPKYQNGNFGYGYNTVLAPDVSGKPRLASQVSAPGQIIVFATCAQVNTFQAPATAKNPMVEEFYQIDPTQTTAHFRHGHAALAAFLDGSVRSLSMATDMLPGSQDKRILSANIGRFNTIYLKPDGW
jgi:prepilin-type N-terminal cleavage/methylation domain-containing protein